MSDGHRDGTPQQAIPASISPSSVLARVGRFRDQMIGTISLVALLVSIFQLEILAADAAGYSSTQVFFSSFSRESKMILSALFGPFIHQGPAHLIDNLGVLFVTGAYIEYEYDRRELYQIYLLVGYFAAWVPLAYGFAGSVGASGVTYGLSGWLFIHSLSRVLDMAYDGTIDERIIHSLPLIIGLGLVSKVAELVGSSVGAGDITHFYGAIFGLFLGIIFVFDYHNIRLKFW